MWIDTAGLSKNVSFSQIIRTNRNDELPQIFVRIVSNRARSSVDFLSSSITSKVFSSSQPNFWRRCKEFTTEIFPYGGSTKTMSHLVLLFKKDDGAAARSIFNTAVFVARNFSKFLLIVAIAAGDLSKKYANFAPRDNASIPSAPDPAKQSSTIFSAKFSTQPIELSMSKMT